MDEPPSQDSTPFDFDRWMAAKIQKLDEFLRDVGLSNPRIKWRLHHWQGELEAKSERRREALNRPPPPVLCPSCGLVAGSQKTVCPHCDTPLKGPQAWVGQARRGLAQGSDGGTSLGVSQTFLFIMVGIFVLGLALGLAQGEAGTGMNLGSRSILHRAGIFVPQWVAAGDYWRLITPLFLHGGIMHIVFNAMALSYIGPQIESMYGGPRFAFLFLMSGLFGHLGTTVWAILFKGGMVASLGASGAIFGLIGALCVASTRYGGPGAGMARDLAKRWILFGLVFGIVMPGIDNGAHVGGLLGGGLMTLLVGDPWI